MAAISKIKIDGFKAFPKEFELVLDGKNLLMYGENGSGKSSIYYALHALLQSQYHDKGAIYFDKHNSESLVNKYTTTADPYIEIELKGSVIKYHLSRNGYEELPAQAISPLRDMNAECVFINHKFLFNSFSFRNSQYIDLFPVFIKDILPFTFTDDKSKYISELYDEVLAGIQRRGRGLQVTSEYDNLINRFNQEVLRIIGKINYKYDINAPSLVSNIYNNHFRDSDDRELSIELNYENNRDHIPQPNKSYWLRYGYRYQQTTIAHEIKEERISRKYEILSPVIRLIIKEKKDDGTWSDIDKPQTQLNEAKLTAIILSIRFSLLDLVAAPDGRFLALDDMLISLDMSNRAKVVDFLLKISDKYKIYLFTHDKMFFEYFKHKTKKNQDAWVYKEIYMDYDKTPYIRNSEDYLGQAEHYIKQHEYEIAGNFLRKEAEAFCKDFLPKKKQLTGDFAHLDLNGLIMNCKDYAAESGVIDISFFNELDEHRKFILNPSSHDSYDVAKYGHEVKRCLQTLRKLREIIIKPFLKFGSQVEFTLKTPEPRISEYKFILTLCDDFRIIIMPGESPVISKGMINYQVYEDDNNKKGVQSDNTTIKHFFEYNYEKSDKTKDASYLNSVIESESGNPISAFF